MSTQGLSAAVAKMEAAGVDAAAIGTFSRLYRLAEEGASGFLREEDVSPLPTLDRPTPVSPAVAAAALGKTAVMKLNGGLGTSMGMQRAKTLLPVLPDNEGNTLNFLDVIVRQVRAARAATGARLPLLLLDSFRTQADTLAHLAQYPDLPVGELPLSLLQNREPKLTADTLEPVTWPADPSLEWCPPGHGDLYPVLHASGAVKALLAAGFEYLSVANADNLGSFPSAEIAAWFAASGAPYAAEMARKTPADVKGGQLVVRRVDGQIVQRETAQTHPDDMAASLDASVHRFFHTNNLWFNLSALDAELTRTGGVLELPLIRNEKTVD
ncbi:MAG: UTP--glucose-1-phosphate uridylyltransferase, partial [Promicromonosporaceae bacterium]|nr:UTP--glucose-1-phosphate uridylyltransferase [Promicromonosporaceae bacterium]